jgi:hypothetical protein
MRTVAGLLNTGLGAGLIVAVATLVRLDFPANVVAYAVGGLMALAGTAILARAPWGTRLGQWLATGGMVLGVGLLLGSSAALVSQPHGLAAAALVTLGIPVLVASVLAFLASRRARRSAGT